MGKKSFSRPPSKAANKALGGFKPARKLSEQALKMDKGMGNREFGFIQTTPKKATGAMMGRPPPKTTGKTSPRSDGRKQFAPKAGKKVF